MLSKSSHGLTLTNFVCFTLPGVQDRIYDKLSSHPELAHGEFSFESLSPKQEYNGWRWWFGYGGVRWKYQWQC